MHACVCGRDNCQGDWLKCCTNILIVIGDHAMMRGRYRILDSQTEGASTFLAGLGLDRKRGQGLTSLSGRAISISVYDTGSVIIDCDDAVMNKLINDYFLTLPFDYPAYASETLGVDLPDRWIGTDEAGKGDYFGPLVVAGVCMDRDSASLLFKHGLTDSKKVSAARLTELEKGVKEILPPRSVEVIVISPERYNQLHSSMGNVLDIMVWAHSKLIKTLSETTGSSVAVVDKFSTGRRSEFLEKSVPGVVIHQFTHGEREMGVAAASVLATSQFNRSIDKLSEMHGLKLLKGAGVNVKALAREIRQSSGEAFYRKLAKADFIL